jgi:hypothetical protein
VEVLLKAQRLQRGGSPDTQLQRTLAPLSRCAARARAPPERRLGAGA